MSERDRQEAESRLRALLGAREVTGRLDIHDDDELARDIATVLRRTPTSEGLGAIWDALASVADEGTVRGKIDYARSDGCGLVVFECDGEAYTLDLYRTEDAGESPTSEGGERETLIDDFAEAVIRCAMSVERGSAPSDGELAYRASARKALRAALTGGGQGTLATRREDGRGDSPHSGTAPDKVRSPAPSPTGGERGALINVLKWCDRSKDPTPRGATEAEALDHIEQISRAALTGGIEPSTDRKALDQDRLLSCCKRLLDLNEDPHPGLGSWNAMCVAVVDEMRGLLATEPATERFVRTIVCPACATMDDVECTLRCDTPGCDGLGSYVRGERRSEPATPREPFGWVPATAEQDLADLGHTRVYRTRELGAGRDGIAVFRRTPTSEGGHDTGQEDARTVHDGTQDCAGRPQDPDNPNDPYWGGAPLSAVAARVPTTEGGEREALLQFLSINAQREGDRYWLNEPAYQHMVDGLRALATEPATPREPEGVVEGMDGIPEEVYIADLSGEGDLTWSIVPPGDSEEKGVGWVRFVRAEATLPMVDRQRVYEAVERLTGREFCRTRHMREIVDATIDAQQATPREPEPDLSEYVSHKRGCRFKQGVGGPHPCTCGLLERLGVQPPTEGENDGGD